MNKSRETAEGERNMKEKATSVIEGGATVCTMGRNEVKREKRLVEHREVVEDGAGLDYIV